MPIRAGDPPEVARAVADALERARVPYALGGALAYNFYGASRSTIDVDFNVFLPPEQARPVFEQLKADGLDIDVETSLARVLDGRHAIGTAGKVHVDLFFNSIPLHEAAAERVRTFRFESRPIRSLAAEDIVLLKLMFFRPKDKLDIQRVIQVQGPKLDRAYVRRWLVDLMGEDDERVRVWDQYCRELPGT